MSPLFLRVTEWLKAPLVNAGVEGMRWREGTAVSCHRGP